MQILIYATTFIGTSKKARLLEHWLDLRLKLDGGNCDILLVDSHSPWPRLHDKPLIDEHYAKRVTVHSFDDNIGHSHFGGCDGFGRSFCHGLTTAINDNYDYVAHIEGDMLFRLPVARVVDEMKCHNIMALSTFDPSNAYVETGLMFFNVGYLRQRKLVEAYNWKSRENYIAEHLLADLLGDDLFLKRWRGLRNDRGDNDKITLENMLSRAPIWITHADPEIYEHFMKLFAMDEQPRA